jgi:pentatricopeptide repeat protein
MERILKRLIHHYSSTSASNNNAQEGGDSLETNAFNLVIGTWLKVKHLESGERSLKVLNQMKGIYRLGATKCEPNTLSFSMAIEALLHSEVRGAVLAAEELLQDLIYFWEESEGKGRCRPEKEIFDRVLFMLGSEKGYVNGAEDVAFKLLRQMEKFETIGIIPDAKSYNSAMRVFLRKRTRRSEEVIESLIDEMENKLSKVDTVSYNTLMKAYANAGNATKANNLLRKMKAEYQSGKIYLKPDSSTYNTVIEAYAKIESANGAARILNEMKELYEKGDENVQPDRVSITLLLNALARGAKRNRDAGDQAITVLDRMNTMYNNGNECMKPDTITFTAAIDCIAKSRQKDSGQKSLELLSRMQGLYQAGSMDVKPDRVTFNKVLSAVANSRARDSGEKVEQILFEMQRSGDPSIAPDTVSFSTAMSAWANCGSKLSSKKVQRLLQMMEDEGGDIAPNNVTYASVLNVLAKSQDPSAFDRSMEILEKIEGRMEDGDFSVQPNAYIYSSLMQKISNTPCRDKILQNAEELMQRMIESYQKYPPKKRESHTVFFNTAMKAIENSLEERKFARAEIIFKDMSNLNESGLIVAKPNVRTYNAFLRCCALTTGSKEDKYQAFNAAKAALMQLRSESRPDLYTYPALFKACDLLLDQTSHDFDHIITEMFGFCCQDGFVDGLVLKNLKNALPLILLRSLFGTTLRNQKLDPQTVRINDLPKRWSRNIYSQKGSGRKTRE